jgi:hypothetical protein
MKVIQDLATEPGRQGHVAHEMLVSLEMIAEVPRTGLFFGWSQAVLVI